MCLKKLKKKVALITLAGSLMVPTMISYASAKEYDNYYDNPVGYKYDKMENNYSTDSFPLKWKGSDTYSGGKETVSRKKFTKDSIYIKISSAKQGDKDIGKFQVSTEYDGGGCDTINYYGYFVTKFREYKTKTSYLISNYVYEYAETYHEFEVHKSEGKIYNVAPCNLEFANLTSNQNKTNEIKGVWSPDIY